eukprot:238946_1
MIDSHPNAFIDLDQIHQIMTIKSSYLNFDTNSNRDRAIKAVIGVSKLSFTGDIEHFVGLDGSNCHRSIQYHDPLSIYSSFGLNASNDWNRLSIFTADAVNRCANPNIFDLDGIGRHSIGFSICILWCQIVLCFISPPFQSIISIDSSLLIFQMHLLLFVEFLANAWEFLCHHECLACSHCYNIAQPSRATCSCMISLKSDFTRRIQRRQPVIILVDSFRFELVVFVRCNND